jgi:hypothetical protein
LGPRRGGYRAILRYEWCRHCCVAAADCCVPASGRHVAVRMLVSDWIIPACGCPRPEQSPHCC